MEEAAMDSFRVVPIPQAVADRIRETRKDGHGNTGIEPTRADAPRGFPCRVCLEEAKVGEEVLLFSYSPFERPVPYRSVGPVFVHARSCAPYGPRASVPELMRSRLISLRAYDSRRSEEHTSELQSRGHLVCRLLLEK